MKIKICDAPYLVGIEELRFHPKNESLRTISPERLEDLKRSLKKKGFYQPILVWKKNNFILSGNHRVKAAQELIKEGHTFTSEEGDNLMPVVYEDVTDEMAEAILHESNTQYADWIEERLKSAIQEATAAGIDTKTWGYSDQELKRILDDAVRDSEDILASVSATNEADTADAVIESSDTADAVKKEKEAKEDKIKEEAPKLAKRGQIWKLGRHFLMCGDSLKMDDVETLMGDERADMIFTDPPYNVASNTKGVASTAPTNKQNKKLMDSEWDKNFDIKPLFPILEFAGSKNCSFYVCTSSFLAPDIWAWMKERLDFHSYCVWSKPNPFPSLMKRHWVFGTELVCYGTRGKHTFNYPEEGNALSVWTIPIGEGGLHPTQKPVRVPEHAILHSSNKHQIVLDLFGGSGTTLIACEKHDRTCYMMEKEESYCDIILQRWKDYTGVEPKLFKTITEVRKAKNG